jgi:MarC family membrane protein
MEFIFSTALLFFLVMDPLGNLPFFISSLKKAPSERYLKIIFRESVIALVVLTIFMLVGKDILGILQISQASLGIAGGIILFLIALQMIFCLPIFSPAIDNNEDKKREEPFIVPLAVPMIAGPSAVATIILVRGRADASLIDCFIALAIAWCLSTIILMFSKMLSRVLGHKILDASESLMGLLLTALAIEMLVKGIKSAFFQ